MLLCCHAERPRALQSIWNTGTSSRSQRGAPSPAASKRTEANPVPQSTAATASRRYRSATPSCTAASRRLLTQRPRGARPR